jgi:hypothetical protein
LGSRLSQHLEPSLTDGRFCESAMTSSKNSHNPGAIEAIEAAAANGNFE